MHSDFIQYYTKIVLEAEFPPSAHFFTTLDTAFAKTLFSCGGRPHTWILGDRVQHAPIGHKVHTLLKKQKENNQEW